MLKIFKDNILKKKSDTEEEIIEVGVQNEEKVSLKVSGKAVKRNGIVKVSKGMTILEIFEELEGDKEILNKVIQGSVFYGIQKSSLDEKISGDEKELVFLTKDEAKRGVESPCIRCAKCLRVCKEGLNPIKLVDIYKKSDKDEFFKFGGNRCTECGLCTYVCPSNIEISHKIKTGKSIFK
ncbi:MAG: 4Fe-4S dicluster domain-containing protein [Clostridium sp.]|uniref:4Fe-4S dicluster domain-containing protein n=1 Tax=Clostridium sp. TaxID=1506 RepID=UPI003EE7C92E